MMLPTRALSVMFLVGAFGLPDKTKSTALARHSSDEKFNEDCSWAKDKRNRHKKIFRQALRMFRKEHHESKDTKAPLRHATWGDDDDVDKTNYNYYYNYYDGEYGDLLTCDERAEQFADNTWRWYKEMDTNGDGNIDTSELTKFYEESCDHQKQSEIENQAVYQSYGWDYDPEGHHTQCMSDVHCMVTWELEWLGSGEDGVISKADMENFWREEMSEWYMGEACPRKQQQQEVDAQIFDDPHVRTLSGNQFFLHGVGVFDYATIPGVIKTQVYMCPFAPCTKKMMDSGDCLTFINAVAIKMENVHPSQQHTVVLRNSSLRVDKVDRKGDVNITFGGTVITASGKVTLPSP